MLQDPADGHGCVDEGDDLQPAAAIGADQRVDLVDCRTYAQASRADWSFVLPFVLGAAVEVE